MQKLVINNPLIATGAGCFLIGVIVGEFLLVGPMLWREWVNQYKRHRESKKKEQEARWDK